MNSPLPRLLAAALLATASCSTILTEDETAVTIYSSPPGASYETNTGDSGTTPGTVFVPQRLTLRVTLEKEGYETTTVEHAPRPSFWLVGNAVFTHPYLWIGLGVDILSGNWRTHSRELDVTLQPVEGAAGEAAPAGDAPGPAADAGA